MALIEFSNGVNMLMDCRSSSNRPSPIQYLKERINKLDFIIISHPHQDHLTGLKDVCEHFRPSYFWHNGRYFKPDPIYEDWSYYEKLRKGEMGYCTPVQVHRGQTATIGDSKISVAGPETPYLGDTFDDENNNSIMLVVTTGRSRVVLTGDTEKEQWAACNLTVLANASVFLASHHGREDGYSEEALSTINPQHIIISDGTPGEIDATERYRQIAPVSTTRKNTIVLRPT